MGVSIEYSTRMSWFGLRAHAVLATSLLIFAASLLPVLASDLNFQLSNATDAGNVDLCKTLIAAGADVNAPPTTGALTPLMTAAAKGNPELVRLFLQAGADPNARATAHWNRTALMFAVDTPPTDKTVEIVRLLLDSGTDATLKDSEGRTALVSALKYASDPKSGKAVDLIKGKLQKPEAEVEPASQSALAAPPIEQ